MDNEVHVESSSSQSANTVIECKAGAIGRIHIDLSDGSSFFVPAAFFGVSLPQAGDVVSEELLLDLRVEASFLVAQDRAIKLLARRDHSAFELSRKLLIRLTQQPATCSVWQLCHNFLPRHRFASSSRCSRTRTHACGTYSTFVGRRVSSVHRVVGRLITPTPPGGPSSARTAGSTSA